MGSTELDRTTELRIDCRSCREFLSILCASPPYITERGTPSSVAELADRRCPQTTSPTLPGSRWPLDGPNGGKIFELPPLRFRVNVAEAMAFAIRDGLGVGALLLWTALPWLRDGTLIPECSSMTS